jgi:hypothetical protein
MTSEIQNKAVSKKEFWIGWIMSVVPMLMLVMGAVMDFTKPDFAVKGTIQLGYPESCMTPLGIVVLVCVALYLIPRTAILGAILLTGYLGGAVATHVRVSAPLGEVFFPVIFGVIVWVGIFLRDARLRQLIPLRR